MGKELNYIENWKEKKEYILLHLTMFSKALNEIDMFIGFDQKKQAFCFVDFEDHGRGFYVTFEEIKREQEEFKNNE